MTKITLTSYTVGVGADMQQPLPFSILQQASHETGTRFVFSDPGTPDVRCVVTGTGFTYDDHGHVTGGTITRLAFQLTTGDPVNVAVFDDLNLSQANFNTYVQAANWDGLRKAMMSGDDVVNGTAFDDTLVLSDGGKDKVFGNTGNDTFVFGSAFNANDRVDGGSGNNTIVLDGDYSAGIKMEAATITNISQFTFTGGHDYNLTLTNDNVTVDKTFYVDGSDLGPGDRMVVHADTIVLPMDLVLIGGAGNDTLYGSTQDDLFNLSAGGNDKVFGGGARLDGDVFDFGATFNGRDEVTGGIVDLDGDYAAGTTLSAKTLTQVSKILMETGHSYQFFTNDANVAAGATLTIDASALGAADRLLFHGQAETDGGFSVQGGAGDDVFYGGAMRDTFDTGKGRDTFVGGGGDDAVTFNGAFNEKDKVNGGTGVDSLILHGNYASGVELNGTNLKGVDQILLLESGHNYHLSQDATFAPDYGPEVVAGTDLTSNLTFDGESAGEILRIYGGSGNDKLIGGSGNDYLIGNDGDDVIRGGGGTNLYYGGLGADTLNASGSQGSTFVYLGADESNATAYDTIKNFDWNTDYIALPFQMTGINQGQYVGDDLGQLATVFPDADHLASHHMALAEGNFNALYLVIDANGVPGYQAGQDIVIAIDNSAGTPSLDNFFVQIYLQTR